VPLEELVSRFFKDDKQKRPRPFELGSSEFLATDAPVLAESDTFQMLPTTPSLSSIPAKLRRESMSRGAAISRFAEDFVEEGRLGKGGFGEVVKARQKIGGQIYAIKKVTQRSHVGMSEILKEVRLLSRFSHPAVVRYYNAWLEEVPNTTDTEGETSTEGYTETEDTVSDSMGIEFATSTGGLDFMSSNAAIESGYDYDSDENAIDDDSDDDSSIIADQSGNRVLSPDKERAAQVLRRARQQRAFRTVLYISMEYCEKKVSTSHQWAPRYIFSLDPNFPQDSS
jgi:translation initiation factor 2-alpha kinase 4